jgi:hypothetical protein
MVWPRLVTKGDSIIRIYNERMIPHIDMRHIGENLPGRFQMEIINVKRDGGP